MIGVVGNKEKDKRSAKKENKRGRKGGRVGKQGRVGVARRFEGWLEREGQGNGKGRGGEGVPGAEAEQRRAEADWAIITRASPFLLLFAANRAFLS